MIKKGERFVIVGESRSSRLQCSLFSVRPCALGMNMSTYDELIQACLEHIDVNALSARVLYWRERILYHYFELAKPSTDQGYLTKLHVKVHIDLMQNHPQTPHPHITNHHKLQVRRRLVIMQLVFRRPITDKAIGWSTELLDHAAQREYHTEDEFRVIFAAELVRSARGSCGRGERCATGR